MSGPAKRVLSKFARPEKEHEWQSFMETLSLQIDDLVRDAQIFGPYANNAAALAGGLQKGQKYRTGGDPDLIAVVH
jgi:hypothetical protein